METKAITVYQFDELDESAKKKAREWYRQGALDYDWWDSTTEDFKEICSILGVTVTDGPFFSVSWSQSDYASFGGYYEYAKGCQKRIREYAPFDKVLHAMADALTREQRKVFYSGTGAWSASDGHRPRDMSAELGEQYSGDIVGEWLDTIDEMVRDLEHWLYIRLRNEAEWMLEEVEWMLEDEQVDESIRANEYPFTESGSRCLVLS